MVSWQLLVNLVAVSFVYPDGSCLCLVVKVGFLDQIGDDIVDVAILWYEKIVLLLKFLSDTAIKSGADIKYLFSNSFT